MALSTTAAQKRARLNALQLRAAIATELACGGPLGPLLDLATGSGEITRQIVEAACSTELHLTDFSPGSTLSVAVPTLHRTVSGSRSPGVNATPSPCSEKHHPSSTRSSCALASLRIRGR